MKLLTFSGFKGRASMVRIADIEFFIVARNDEQLAILHEAILKQADAPFNSDAVQPVILISSKTLPEPKPTNEQNSAS